MTKFKQTNKQNQTGAALVMSLLILSLMMISSVALSRIILGEIKMVINTTNSLAAFYTADSGIEKALYYIKYARKNRGILTFDSTAPFDNLGHKTFPISSSQFFYYEQASTTSPGFTAYNISPTSPAHIDIIDPSGNIPSAIDWDTDPAHFGWDHSYILSWSIKDCFPSHVSDKIEITKHSFSNPGVFSPNTEKSIVICDCAYNSLDVCNESLTSANILDNRYYRFSVRPLDSDIESLSFDVIAKNPITYDPNNPATYDVVGIASNSSVIVDGTYKNARYRLKAEMPFLGSVSDIFSYVIFSEESLKKVD